MSSRLNKRLNAGAASITKLFVTAIPRHLSRIAIVTVTMVAWFSISNHCALSAFESAQHGQAHPACHETPGAPAKSPAKGEAPPCCKLLRATLAKLDQPVIENYFTGLLQAWLSAALVSTEQFHWPQSFELDTGPPFSESFAESVLQRSILAHAPPFSLS
jgi:hypothetical protein